MIEAETILNNFINKLREEIDILKEAITDDIDDWGDKIWTKIIKKSFSILGKENKLKVYSHEDGGEYLLDLVWESRDEDNGGLLLGLESEWNNTKNEIECDFYKLMYTKCNLKFFVYCSTSAKKREELTDVFRKSLAWFNKHIQGEQYIFIDVTDYKPYKIMCDKFDVPKNGKIDKDTIEFHKIGEFDWDEINKNYRL